MEVNRDLLSKLTRTFAVLCASFFFLAASGCDRSTGGANTKDHTEERMTFQIPNSIRAEHAELHHQLEDAIKSGGNTGAAAQIVADRLHAHFEKEEAYALPPLGLLSPLAQGKVSEDMKRGLELSDKLKQELPQMLNEHKAITLALDELSNAAINENKTAAVEFAERLRMHAQNEEEVLYPAAILVGEYLKLRLK